MKAIRRFLRREPAMVITLVLAAVNAVANLSSGQEEAVRQLVEAAIILVGGGAIRQQVTPTGDK